MALPSLPHICPDVPLQVERTWRVWAQTLGDGYELRQLQGINALQSKYNVTWSGRRLAEIQQLEAFLESMGARPFLLHDPVADVDVAVFCDGWNSTASGRLKEGGLYGALVATFRRAYGYH